MVSKRKTATKQVKVGELKLNKETLKDLSKQDAKAVKGGGESLSCLPTCKGQIKVPVIQTEDCHIR